MLRANGAYRSSLGNPHLRGKTTVNGHAFSLDHILSLNSPYIVERHVVVVDQEALDSTDHSPVFVDIDM